MKLNKIISAIAAIAMISTSLVSVSAAGKIETTYDPIMEIDLVSNLPSKAEVEARQPKLVVDSIVKLEGTEIKNNTSNQFYAKNINNDVYLITYSYTNLGELINGVNAEYNEAAIGIYQASLRLYGKNNDILGTWGPGEENSFGWADATGCYTSTAITYSIKNPYPTASDNMDAVYEENGTVTGKVAVALTAGKSATFTAENIGGSVSYSLVENGAGQQIPIQEFEVPASITFGTPAQEPDEPGDDEGDQDIIISDRLTLENLGYAWDVTINNYDSNKTYTATFTAPGESDKVNDLILSGAEADNGTIAFAALLKTTKANVELAIAKN